MHQSSACPMQTQGENKVNMKSVLMENGENEFLEMRQTKTNSQWFWLPKLGYFFPWKPLQKEMPSREGLDKGKCGAGHTCFSCSLMVGNSPPKVKVRHQLEILETMIWTGGLADTMASHIESWAVAIKYQT